MLGVTIASVRNVAEWSCRSGGPLPIGILRDAKRIAGADFDLASFEREGDDAFDAADGLLGGIVPVRGGKVGFTLSCI
jgi:hypothetical protein